MNDLLKNNWTWIKGVNDMRSGVLEILNDKDLAFTLGGKSKTFGILLKEAGENEKVYIQSFKTFTLESSYNNSDKALSNDIALLTKWFQDLDDEFSTTIFALSENDLENQITRPEGNTVSVEQQIQIYIQAMFIFLGKAVVYLQAMNKPLPPSLEKYIG